MRLKVRSWLSLLSVLASCSAAHAQNLNFNGLAMPACALNVPIDGAIALQPDLKSWATTLPATIVATNTAPSMLTVTRAGAWSVAPPSTPATTFEHTVSVTGANLASITGSGTAKSVPLTMIGNNQVSVSVGASAATPFGAGIYVAQVTVTCAVVP